MQQSSRSPTKRSIICAWARNMKMRSRCGNLFSPESSVHRALPAGKFNASSQLSKNTLPDAYQQRRRKKLLNRQNLPIILPLNIVLPKKKIEANLSHRDSFLLESEKGQILFFKTVFRNEDSATRRKASRNISETQVENANNHPFRIQSKKF